MYYFFILNGTCAFVLSISSSCKSVYNIGHPHTLRGGERGGGGWGGVDCLYKADALISRVKFLGSDPFLNKI